MSAVVPEETEYGRERMCEAINHEISRKQSTLIIKFFSLFNFFLLCIKMRESTRKNTRRSCTAENTTDLKFTGIIYRMSTKDVLILVWMQLSTVCLRLNHVILVISDCFSTLNRTVKNPYLNLLLRSDYCCSIINLQGDMKAAVNKNMSA